MAEVLGVVASGISIGSLAGQLLESLPKIHRFWKNVDGAPKDIGDLIQELQVLASVFYELMNQPADSQALPSQSIQTCLQYCCKILDELGPIVLKLHGDLAKGKQRKQWASIKSAFKQEDLRELTQRLERSKTTLGIAIDCCRLSLQQQHSGVLLQQLTLQEQQATFCQQLTAFQQKQTAWQEQQTVLLQQQSTSLTQLLTLAHQSVGSTTAPLQNEGNSKLPRASSATGTSITSLANKKIVTSITAMQVRFGFGWCHYQSKSIASRSVSHPPGPSTPQGSNDDKEVEMTYFPAPWLGSRGFSFRAMRTWGGWQYSLRPTRIATDLAIFGHARRGRISEMIKLLESGQATLYDTNKAGWNLLHYAAFGRQVRTCEWLIEQGVRADATYNGLTPLHIFVRRLPDTDYTAEDFQNTARILIEQGHNDPMAANEDGHSPLHMYMGPPATFDYITTQQNHFQIDLEQKGKRAHNVVQSILNISNCHGGQASGLHLIKHFWDTGRIETGEMPVLAIFAILRLFTDDIPSGTNLSIPQLIGMDDMVTWLAGLVAEVPRLHLREYLPMMLAYHCLSNGNSITCPEKDKTSLIRLWMAILREAKLSLHDHFREMEQRVEFRDMELRIGEHYLRDMYVHRQGIQRVFEVEYGADADDVTLLVRDVRVACSPKESIPGSWKSSESFCDTGLAIEGLEPTANWRVWSKEEEVCRLVSKPAVQ